MGLHVVSAKGLEQILHGFVKNTTAQGLALQLHAENKMGAEINFQYQYLRVHQKNWAEDEGFLVYVNRYHPAHFIHFDGQASYSHWGFTTGINYFRGGDPFYKESSALRFWPEFGLFVKFLQNFHGVFSVEYRWVKNFGLRISSPGNKWRISFALVYGIGHGGKLSTNNIFEFKEFYGWALKAWLNIFKHVRVAIDWKNYSAINFQYLTIGVDLHLSRNSSHLRR